METMDAEKISGCIDNVRYYPMKDNYNFNCDIDRRTADSAGHMPCTLFDLQYKKDLNTLSAFMCCL